MSHTPLFADSQKDKNQQEKNRRFLKRSLVIAGVVGGVIIIAVLLKKDRVNTAKFLALTEQYKDMPAKYLDLAESYVTLAESHLDLLEESNHQKFQNRLDKNLDDLTRLRDTSRTLSDDEYLSREMDRLERLDQLVDVA